MKFALTTFALIFIIVNVYGQRHLHVTNTAGGEIAKLESTTGFPQLVIANNHGDIAQIGLSQTANGNSSDDDLKIKTLKDSGKILFEVGTNATNTSLLTINPNNSTAGAYVGINATSPSAPLTVQNVGGGVTAEFRAGPNAETTFVQFTSNSGNLYKGYMGFFNPASLDFQIGTPTFNPTGKLRFQTQNVDRMWVHEDGRIFIGPLNSPGTASLNICGNVQASGNFMGNSFACTSDNRYKKDIRTLSKSLDKITSLTGVNYYWDQENYPDHGFESDKQIGLIAQDVEGIIPELVSTDELGFKTVDYVSLTAVLIEAIKEQQLTINNLEKKVDRIVELENKIMTLVSNE